MRGRVRPAAACSSGRVYWVVHAADARGHARGWLPDCGGWKWGNRWRRIASPGAVSAGLRVMSRRACHRHREPTLVSPDSPEPAWSLSFATDLPIVRPKPRGRLPTGPPRLAVPPPPRAERGFSHPGRTHPRRRGVCFWSRCGGVPDGERRQGQRDSHRQPAKQSRSSQGHAAAETKAANRLILVKVHVQLKYRTRLGHLRVDPSHKSFGTAWDAPGMYRPLPRQRKCRTAGFAPPRPGPSSAQGTRNAARKP